MPGPADPLQPGGDRRRRLDLHDEVDRAHVDAEFEGRGRHDRGQPAGLELLLGDAALLARHRAVVGPRDDLRRAAALARSADELAGDRVGSSIAPPARSKASSLSRAVSRSASRREFANTIVEWCASIRSSTRSSTCGQIELRLSAPAAGPDEVAGGLPELGHVLDRHDDLQVEGLGRRRVHDGHRAAAGQERGHLVERADRGRQPDPLSRALEQRIEPLEAEREVRAALGRAHRVHLVDDHRLDAAQRLARRLRSAAGTATRGW